MSEICRKLHQFLATLPVHHVPFDSAQIPENGIYVLFETGELAHGTSRIVRVGSHTGRNQLRSRLAQHFLNENKDRSIFRKNIGRAILNRDGDPFLQQWNIDLTPRKARDEHSKTINASKLRIIENQVTAYMRKEFWFVVIGMAVTTKRLDLESKLISTIAQCTACRPSKDWLGKFSSIPRIRTGRLWQVKDLDGPPLTVTEYDYLRKIAI